MYDEALSLLAGAGLKVSDEEWANVERADFGLSDFAREGAYMITLASTGRLALKAIVLLPGQVLPEHWHVPSEQLRAKEEFLRPLFGTLYLYTPGDGEPSGRIPMGKESVYTCRHEEVLRPGAQAYLAPGVPHWFAAGDAGCVALSFSSEAKDLTDRFTDPQVVR